MFHDPLQGRRMGCIYSPRFGCGSSRSITLVIPLMNPRCGSSGATAQRRQASRTLGCPGSPTGEVAGPRRTSPESSGRLRSRTARQTRRKDEWLRHLHEGGPKQRARKPPARAGPSEARVLREDLRERRPELQLAAAWAASFFLCSSCRVAPLGADPVPWPAQGAERPGTAPLREPCTPDTAPRAGRTPCSRGTPPSRAPPRATR